MAMAVATTREEVVERTQSVDERPDCLADNLSWLLTQAHFNLVSEIAAAFEPLGVSNRGYHVLATAEAGEFTQKELAEKIGLDKTTMVVTVDELERAGLTRAHTVQYGSARPRHLSDEGGGAQGPPGPGDSQPDPERCPHQPCLREAEVFLEALGTLVEDGLSEPVECSRASPARARH